MGQPHHNILDAIIATSHGEAQPTLRIITFCVGQAKVADLDINLQRMLGNNTVVVYMAASLGVINYLEKSIIIGILFVIYEV